MFGKQSRTLWLRLSDATGNPLMNAPLSRLHVPEPVILSLCMEYYADPEPCHIHRGAAQSKVCLELAQALEGRGVIAVDTLPAPIRNGLSGYPEARWAELRAEGGS